MTFDYQKAIYQNSVYRSKLGWKPQEIVPGVTDVTMMFVDGVIALQKAMPLPPIDGVCGPATYSVLLAQRQAHLFGPTGVRTLEDLGMLAMCELKRLWLRNLVDLPPITDRRYNECRDTFARLIQTSEGLGWSWVSIPHDTPSIHSVMQFCGTGPAYGWGRAGLRLDIRKALFSSTLRLDAYGGYKPFDDSHSNKKPATGPYRMMITCDEHTKPEDVKFPDGSLPRAGDIVLVGGVATGPGKHIATAELYDAATGVFTTIELNGGGWMPDGSRNRGCVRAIRKVGLRAGEPPTTYFVRRVIRPAMPDCL